MSPIANRKIGSASIPAIGFGAMGLGTPWYGKTQSDEERFKVLDAAYEKGSTHWDTSDVYGDSEELIGKWFKRTGKRDEIFLATKFAFVPGGGWETIRGDPEYVKEAVNRNLERLGVDSIDLLYLHRVDPKTPIELTVRAMAEFVKAGKVKYLGLSECSAACLRRAAAVHPISALQIEYSPFALEVESPDVGLWQAAKELGVTIVAYSPLGRGLLTGNYKSAADFTGDDFRQYLPKYSNENFPHILSLVSHIKSIGSKSGRNATPGQVAIAWLLAQGENIVVIPGTTKVKYLEENVDSANVSLTPTEVAEIREAAEKANKALVGGRYAEGAGASMVFADSPPLKE